MHAAPHAFWPAPHAQTWFWQVSPLTAAQSPSPQQPLDAMHTPLHSFAPVPHAQVPLVHVPLTPQSASWQQPLGLHWPMHALWPLGHAQVCDWQVWPVTAPQSESWQQLVLAMHCVPQTFCPLGHAHAPL
jgi:hypothetical protein